MTSTNLYWIPGPWLGKLAVAARPRGGDWLGDEMRGWRENGVGSVLSLLTADEVSDLDLGAEPQLADLAGLKFRLLPIPDRQVPSSPSQVTPVLEEIDADLSAGSNAVIHCRQGVGRSGMIAACLLVLRGTDPASAIAAVEQARGTTVPETQEQRHWIDLFASNLTSAK